MSLHGDGYLLTNRIPDHKARTLCLLELACDCVASGRGPFHADTEQLDSGISLHRPPLNDGTVELKCFVQRRRALLNYFRPLLAQKVQPLCLEVAALVRNSCLPCSSFLCRFRWGTFSMKKKPEPTRPEFYGAGSQLCWLEPDDENLVSHHKKLTRLAASILSPAGSTGLSALCSSCGTAKQHERLAGSTHGASGFGRSCLAILSSQRLGCQRLHASSSKNSDAFLAPPSRSAGFPHRPFFRGGHSNGASPHLPQERWTDHVPG